jgi:hypothetical protein
LGVPYARCCECPKPLIFADEPDTCQRCGREVDAPVDRSTKRVAMTIVEIALGRRRLVETKGQHPLD